MRCRDRGRAWPAIFSLVAALAAGTLLLVGCALKKPPDAATLKGEAMPKVALPPQWTAAGAGTGAVTDNWVTTFHDDQMTARQHFVQLALLLGHRLPGRDGDQCREPDHRVTQHV